MSAARFIALRDRGVDLWTEIEAHRLSQNGRIDSKSRQNLFLSIAAAFAGVVAGASGAKFSEQLGNSSAWVIGFAGFFSALCAALIPILKLSEEVQHATVHSQKLKALQDAIRNHIYRMRIEATFLEEDERRFFEQRGDDLRSMNLRTGSTFAEFEAAAVATRNNYEFPSIEYVGVEQADEVESIQEPSDDLVAFDIGGNQ